jgi:hypothetical protein
MEMPVDFLTNGQPFWEKHGHRHPQYKVCCACGEELQNPQLYLEDIFSWFDRHLPHEGKDPSLYLLPKDK